MAFIPEDKIRDIRNAADIVEVVSESVLLKKAGKDYKGLCPFHSEKTPSFTVSPEKQIFHCFGCGTGGNVFTFLMKQEGLSFPEALRTLARRYGVDIPEQRMSAEQKRQMNEREALLDINRQAANFFHHILSTDPAGREGRAYLEKRGITKETIDQFQIGYAADEWDQLTPFFRKKEVPLPSVEKAGLIIPRKGDGFYDRFRNRIIFPIVDAQGRVIAFGGRVMDASLPKYLNSPETRLFNKSLALYGLHSARHQCRETGRVFIVEGYVDVLALHQHGIKNAVATLGTSLTPGHLRLLKGYSDNAILVYDSDEAGIQAARRSVEVFRKENMDARILVLASGYDPDSFLFEFGAEAFQKAADQALSAISFLTTVAIRTHGLSVEGKLRVISDMKVPLASVQDGMARALYIRELAGLLHVDETAILEKVRVATSGNSRTSPAPAQRKEGSRIEEQIIAMMLQFPEILTDIQNRNLLDHFGDKALQSAGRTILDRRHADSGIQVSEMIGLIEEKEQRNRVASLAMKEERWDNEGCLRLMAQFESRRTRQDKHTLLQKIKAAEEENDHERLLKLLEETQTQARKRQSN